MLCSGLWSGLMRLNFISLLWTTKWCFIKLSWTSGWSVGSWTISRKNAGTHREKCVWPNARKYVHSISMDSNVPGQFPLALIANEAEVCQKEISYYVTQIKGCWRHVIHLSASSTLDVATSSLAIKVGQEGPMSHTSHTKDTRRCQLYCS